MLWSQIKIGRVHKLSKPQELWSWAVFLGAQHLLLRTDNSSKSKWNNELATLKRTMLWKKEQKQLGKALFLQYCVDAGRWVRYDNAEIKRQQVVLSGDRRSVTASFVTPLEFHPCKNTPRAFSAGQCQETSRFSFTASSWEVFPCWALTNRLPNGFLSPPSIGSLEAMPRLNWGTVRLQRKCSISVGWETCPDSRVNLSSRCPCFTGAGWLG